mmetsp:Transcript_20773/g.48208  ORF Transcript_20773/g.48208 Transcript_20773/m.48208 type:complete len:294 (-) Transcript_20773:27-908(-)
MWCTPPRMPSKGALVQHHGSPQLYHYDPHGDRRRLEQPQFLVATAPLRRSSSTSALSSPSRRSARVGTPLQGSGDFASQHSYYSPQRVFNWSDYVTTLEGQGDAGSAPHRSTSDNWIRQSRMRTECADGSLSDTSTCDTVMRVPSSPHADADNSGALRRSSSEASLSQQRANLLAELRKRDERIASLHEELRMLSEPQSVRGSYVPSPAQSAVSTASSLDGFAGCWVSSKDSIPQEGLLLASTPSQGGFETPPPKPQKAHRPPRGPACYAVAQDSRRPSRCRLVAEVGAVSIS